MPELQKITSVTTLNIRNANHGNPDLTALRSSVATHECSFCMAFIWSSNLIFSVVLYIPHVLLKHHRVRLATMRTEHRLKSQLSVQRTKQESQLSVQNIKKKKIKI